jgi:hypothetical protein
MKDIHNLVVTQIRILPEDTIPYQILGVPSKLKQLKDNYQFGIEEVPFPLFEPESPKVILLKAGEAKLENKTVVFNLLGFEGRKITLEVSGTSKEADEVFLDLANFINKLAGNTLLAEGRCLTKTEETKCIVTLDFDYWNIFSEKMEDFIKNNLLLMCERPVVSISPKRLSFEIIFNQDPELQKHKVSLAPKPFTVEPRANVPLEDRIFYTHSPFDSDTHLSLINSFEQIFMKTKSAKRQSTHEQG